MLVVLGSVANGCSATRELVAGFSQQKQTVPTTGPESELESASPIELAVFQEESVEPENTGSSLRSPDPQRDEPGVVVSGPVGQAEASAEETSEPTGANPDGTLSLDSVLRSVTDCYPEIASAIGEIETAQGKVVAARGEFDSVISAHSISQPLGFYQTYRNGAGISQPLLGGGEVYGTWRIGDGNFEPWFGERETNEGGELKAGFSLPLVKDRNIDMRRAELQSASLNRERVESSVESRLLKLENAVVQAYWDWVATGQAVQIQKRLLSLAEERVAQIDERIEQGDLARIARIDNQRFIAKRKNDLIKARRSFEKAAIALSLFYRDADCRPVVCGVELVPATFPATASIERQQQEDDLASALASRPELMELAALRRTACVELRYARNLVLPKLDLKGFAGQDIGGETSSKGDKTPFEMQVGLHAEVPVQRREGLGKIQAAEGKLVQIDATTRLVTDKIRARLQDAASAVNAAVEQIQQSQENANLASRSLELARTSFEAGDIDLISLNIYEAAAADAELQVLDANFRYFFYQSAYQAAMSGTAFR